VVVDVDKFFVTFDDVYPRPNRSRIDVEMNNVPATISRLTLQSPPGWLRIELAGGSAIYFGSRIGPSGDEKAILPAGPILPAAILPGSEWYSPLAASDRNNFSARDKKPATSKQLQSGVRSRRTSCTRSSSSRFKGTRRRRLSHLQQLADQRRAQLQQRFADLAVHLAQRQLKNLR